MNLNLKTFFPVDENGFVFHLTTRIVVPNKCSNQLMDWLRLNLFKTIMWNHWMEFMNISSYAPNIRNENSWMETVVITAWMWLSTASIFKLSSCPWMYHFRNDRSIKLWINLICNEDQFWGLITIIHNDRELYSWEILLGKNMRLIGHSNWILSLFGSVFGCQCYRRYLQQQPKLKKITHPILLTRHKQN